MISFNIQEELKKLPEKPGVYIMKNSQKEVIYVGKAIILKNRVRQYFQNSSAHDHKVLKMVAEITEFEYIITGSELEALVLECNLIKKYRPKFNVRMKDDKSYPYIKATLYEEYPKIIMTRKIEKDGGKYFGPYTNSGAVRETINLLKRIFPFKSCNRVLPREIDKDRPCLNFHIKQCMGPCMGSVDKTEYQSMIKDVCSFLSGKQDSIIVSMQEKMVEASDNLNFEKAAVYRDRLISLKHIAEKQKVISNSLDEQDVIAFSKGENEACVQIFFIRGGKLIGRENFIMKGAAMTDSMEIMSSFLKQFYSVSTYIPREIVLQEEIDEIKIIQNWLESKKDAKVHITVPQRGDKKQLVSMVEENAKTALDNFAQKIKTDRQTSENALFGLKSILALRDIPMRIESYDISNTGASEIVGSMVVFENGFPEKDHYRRFKIKSTGKPDDYASMGEMIHRRFTHEKRNSEDSSDQSFSKIPDLILLDGGRSHVSVISSVLKELDIAVPVFGMVKDSRHRTRALVSDETEYNIQENLPLLRFISSIQDEAHRFALKYNRTLRNKRQKMSVLDEIEGIGPKRRTELIKAFRSYEKIREASVEELAKVEGMNKKVAELIFNKFHGG